MVGSVHQEEWRKASGLGFVDRLMDHSPLEMEWRPGRGVALVACGPRSTTQMEITHGPRG
ncbi:hypothetical protein E2562_000302 [Oryza meyeriana var. granulata]|uniref:Uncharacterized protein n=1 Tax=Oryza meyeriana var. granulata TaxID=110450 RepID=A0A6G1CMW9_9ORYZ|nr:hypothetical protein E2562_000302 [Oryza meyeriana var. granulata]